MQIYIWRHNRKFHSHSMINEPCINQSLYTDAIAVVLAESQEQAYELLAQQNQGWLIGDLARLEPTVIDAAKPTVVFQSIHGT